MKLRTSHRIITGAAALSLAFATPLALPGVVVPTAMAEEAILSTVDPAAPASLTIHKYAGPAISQEAHDGSKLGSAPSNTPLEATFTIQRIKNLEVTSNTDWETVNKADKADPVGFATSEERGLVSVPEGPVDGLASAASIVTTEGSATASNLKPGFYLVQETEAPKGYTAAKPFIVALPMTAPNRTNWNYNVHVYPKNDKFSATKTVKDEGQHVGDEITYTIESDIPAVDGETIKAMKITDLLDKRLTLAKGVVNEEKDVKIELVKPKSGSDGETVTDITNWFTLSAKQIEKKDDRTFVYAEATEDGKTKLAAAKTETYAAKVRMTITAKISEFGQNGQYDNDAFVWVNDPGQGTDTEPTPTDPKDPGEDTPGKTPEVKTYMGKVQITKKGVGNEPVDEATFQLYKCTANGTVETFGESNGMAGTTTGGVLTVNGQSEFTSATLEDQKGIVAINGLHVQDFVNGQEVQDSNNAPEGGIAEGTPEAKLTGENAEGYCLVETKAPAGSERLPEPIFFQVKKEAATTMLEFSVKDPDKNAGFELPLTGARGVILFALLGAGLLLLAGFVSRRNKKAAQ